MRTGERRRRVTDVLTRDEIKALTRASDLAGWWGVISCWGIIAGVFAWVSWWPTWWSIAIGLVLLGGRQLGLSILMHDASHRSLFATRSLNDFVGEWLCAAPAWGHLHAYRRHHLAHHAHAGTERDPDLGLVEGLPTTPVSMLRKVARDLSGVTGIKRVAALLAMDFGFLTYSASTTARRIDTRERTWRALLQTGARNFGPVLATNWVMFQILRSFEAGWVYLLWVAAYLTTFSLIIRIRSMAEHAGTERSDDDFRNTRTTHANWLARLTVAPYRVNYHLEHHLLMTVPYHQLPRMHQLLRERGALDDAHLARNYRQVLRMMVRGSR